MQTQTIARRHKRVTPKSLDGPAAPIDPLAGRLVVRLPEAFQLLGIGPTKGYQLVKSGDLQTVRIGRRTLVHAHSIRALLGIAA